VDDGEEENLPRQDERRCAIEQNIRELKEVSERTVKEMKDIARDHNSHLGRFRSPRFLKPKHFC